MSTPRQNSRRAPVIPLIHNYCDRWCSACPFTLRCVVGRRLDGKPEPETTSEALQQVHEAFAQTLKLLHKTAKRFHVPQEVLDRPATEPEPAVVDLDAARLERAARNYSRDVASWLRGYRAVRPEVFDAERQELDPQDPIDVISWFTGLIGAKVHRAIHGRQAGADGSSPSRPRLGGDGVGAADEIQTDPNGSAKIALIAIERSLAAWRQLARRAAPEERIAATFISRLGWISNEVERVFPHARAFVRPGFDKGWRRATRRLLDGTDRQD